MTERKRNFEGPQDEMYEAATLAWNLCKTNLVLFKAKFGFYTDQYVSGKLAAIVAARALPDLAARTLARQLAHNRLIEKRDFARDNWLDGAEYIKNNFPEADWKPLLNAAGHSWFQKSDQEDWTALNNMLSAQAGFVRDNEAKLKENDNMPDDYLRKLNTLVDDTLQLYRDYLQFDTDGEKGTDDKNKANNSVYDDLQKMLGHAQRVFVNDEEMKSQFTYASLRERAGAHKVAGVRGNVMDGETNQPLKDVEVSNETKTHNDTTNDAGNFHIKGLGEGKDKLTFKHPGYREATADTDLKAGKTVIIDIKLFKS